MKKQKKKYLSFLTQFQNLKASTQINQELIENLSKNFEKIYMINSENLEFFNKKKIMKKKKKKLIFQIIAFFLIQETLKSLTNF